MPAKTNKPNYFDDVFLGDFIKIRLSLDSMILHKKDLERHMLESNASITTLIRKIDSELEKPESSDAVQASKDALDMLKILTLQRDEFYKIASNERNFHKADTYTATINTLLVKANITKSAKPKNVTFIADDNDSSKSCTARSEVAYDSTQKSIMQRIGNTEFDCSYERSTGQLKGQAKPSPSIQESKPTFSVTRTQNTNHSKAVTNSNRNSFISCHVNRTSTATRRPGNSEAGATLNEKKAVDAKACATELAEEVVNQTSMSF